MDDVYQAAAEIVQQGGHPDQLIMDSPEFDRGDIELPWKALAVYYSVLVYQDPPALQQALSKLGNHVDFSSRRTAAIDFLTAKEMLDECDVTDLFSIVRCITKLDAHQLNVLGY